VTVEAPTTRAQPSRAAAIGRLWDFPVAEKPLNLIVTVFAALFAAYVYMCAQAVATGDQNYKYGDFHALWMSGVIAHEGQPALNYDADALHARQVAMGQNPHAYNPFPYPPTLLLLLAPLGALSERAAYALFMIPSFVLFMLAMVAGRWRDWRWALGACVAPASGIAIISGQSGLLSGALMVGGARLAANRPILSGALFGLLAFKPQLGVLVPFALVAAGMWRAIASAVVTLVILAVASSLAFGQDIWLVWARSLVEYAREFPPVFEYMPTVLANARMLGAPERIALGVQLCVSIPVAVIVWRAFRAGPSPRAWALVWVGTFLATPHAFNYDMPMSAAAALWYLLARWDADRTLSVSEIVTLVLVLILPPLMLALRATGVVASFGPLMLLFVMIARMGETRALAPVAAMSR